MKLAIIATHPVQYHTPLFRELTTRGVVKVRVYYGWEGLALQGHTDPGFGQQVQWDIPLLEGYSYEFVPNVATDPGTHHFHGLNNPSLLSRVLPWQPDAILIFGWAYKSHLRALCSFHGQVPVLFRGDSTLLDEQPGPRQWLRRLWLRWVYHHVDLALSVGTHNHAYFRAHRLREEQLLWAPHAIENARFADAVGCYQEEARQWRHTLGIQDGEVAFLFAGKLEPKKAPDLLLEAFLRLIP